MKNQHIPNLLSFLRLLLIVPFLYFLNQKYFIQSFYIFLLAGLTDGLDGWLARRFGWQTPLGAFIDPLADKLLVVSSFIALAVLSLLPWWLVILVFLRDFTLSVGAIAWYFGVERVYEFTPSKLSKINTALQILLIALCLFDIAFHRLSVNFIAILIYLTAIMTTMTYLHYVWIWGKKACVIKHSFP